MAEQGELAAVSKKVGLTDGQQQDQFFPLMPAVGRTSSQQSVILFRVEELLVYHARAERLTESICLLPSDLKAHVRGDELDEPLQ